jgi:iron-sulfur cluster repair protein YtfE (RIC family)
MNAAEFLAALDTVERDHQILLDKVQGLKNAVSALLDSEDVGTGRAFERLREVNRYLATVFEAHMEEEETTLFPLLARCSCEGPGLVDRLRQEHADIRTRRTQFDSALQVAGELEDRLPRAVLWDLLTDGWELWEVLNTHAHAETQALHQCLTRSYKIGGGE